MSRIAFVSGRYVPHRAASVSIEDRGYQFADGVYEVIAVHRRRLVDLDLHFARLARSLQALGISAPASDRTLEHILGRVIRRNRLDDGMVYVQITRGVAPRDHAFPPDAAPQLVVTARRLKPPSEAMLEQGVRVITIPEQRWARRDIKSVSLLPNVLGKQQAREQGAYEAWQVENGFVTEGTSSNAWIVTPDQEIVTAEEGPHILNGVTRLVTIDLARRHGFKLALRPFTVAEAKQAKEAFVTSTTALVIPVTQIDDTVIANGRPGSVSMRLRALLAAHLDQRGIAS
jgi:D-alanine transaminase